MLRSAIIFVLLLAVSAIQFDIPIYKDCETEYSTYRSRFQYDEALYGTRSQHLDRRAIFCARLEVIKAHNERALAGEETYSKGVNDFTDWTHEEISAYTRVQRVSDDERYGNETIGSPVFEPELFDPQATSDFRGKMPAAKNQGGCGSCWSFSAVAVMDFFGGSHSEQQYVDCVTNSYGCDGGWADDALNWAVKYGADTESQYPYTGRDGSCHQSGRGAKVYGVQRLTKSANAIKSAGLKQVVSTAIYFDSNYSDDFMDYSSGIFSGHCGRPSGGHAIAVAGIQSGYYIIRNSWGKSWGINGYMYMKSGSDICTMESGKQGAPYIAQM